MKFTAAVTLSALASTASAHIAMWHPSMYGWNKGEAPPANPLQRLDFGGWWFHSYIHDPPAPNVFMELPAGGVFKGQVSCNKAWTTYGKGMPGNNPMGCNAPGADGNGGALHTTDKWETPDSQLKNVKGCGLAIAYKSVAYDVKPEDFVVISTNDKCPWRRNVDFQIPAGLPKCPPGGCHCMWGWIHNSDAGEQQMYQIVYRCQVTGQTGNRALPAPQVARKCPFDKNNCTVGAKQPHYWLQKERNNNNQHWLDPPFYNNDYGFTNGAQTDLWATPKDFSKYNGGFAPGPMQTPTMHIAVTPVGQGTTAPKVVKRSDGVQDTEDAPAAQVTAAPEVVAEEVQAETEEGRRVPPQARRAVKKL